MYVPFRTSSEVGTYVFDVAGNGIVDTQRFENISNVSGERIITIDANRVRVLDTNFGRIAQANIEATSYELEHADLNDDVLVVFEERFGLLGYDVGSGLERWSISTELDTFPVVEDGKIYTLEDNAINIYGVIDGALLGSIEVANSDGVEAGITMMRVSANQIFLGFSNHEIVIAITIDL